MACAEFANIMHCDPSFVRWGTMEGKKSEKAKVCWTRRCPKALFPRISIIIARLAIQVRVCRTYTYIRFREKLRFHEKPIVASRRRIRSQFFGCFGATRRKRRLRHGIRRLTHLPAPNRRCNWRCSRLADSRQDRIRKEFAGETIN